MPELPEVEVTRRWIAPVLLGRRIAEVRTTRPSAVFLTGPRALRERLLGRSVKSLDRVGKYLLFRLDDGGTLILHLGMTGQLLADGARSLRLLSAGRRRAPDALEEFVPDQHTHLVLRFRDRGPSVYYRDARKFGKILWLAPGASHERLEHLGVDALAARGQDLWEACRRRVAPIKTLLLHQSVLAGVGNIYADEALHLAGVRGTRRASRCSRAECDAIVAALRRVMRRSIATGGSSISDFVRPDGSDGGYQSERRVYAREGLPCRRCSTPIRRVVIGQRSAHYCPHCQR